MTAPALRVAHACGACGRTFAPFENARIMPNGRLAHLACASLPTCTVCERATGPAERDASGRCTECQP